MYNLQGSEILLLLVFAVIILGPHRLPEYAAKLAHGVRALRDLAEGARSQIKEEMGPAFDDVDWRTLDPRQYDPRRIVREALASPERTGSSAAQRKTTTAEAAGMGAVDGAEPSAARPARPPRPSRSGRGARHDPSVPTPFDADAT